MVNPPFPVQVLDRLVAGRVEHDSIVERLMGEGVTLHIPPVQLDVVEFLRVTRQPFDGDPTSSGERRGSGLRSWIVPLSSTPIIATFRVRTGAATRRSAPVWEVGMRQRLIFIGIQQNDIAGPDLLTPYLETQSDAVDLVGVLPDFQSVSRTAPSVRRGSGSTHFCPTPAAPTAGTTPGGSPPAASAGQQAGQGHNPR